MDRATLCNARSGRRTVDSSAGGPSGTAQGEIAAFESVGESVTGEGKSTTGDRCSGR
jgi:hypothetical protein